MFAVMVAATPPSVANFATAIGDGTVIAETLSLVASESIPFWRVDSSPRLASAIRRELDQSGYLALRGVTCEVAGGVARLGGRVRSYYLKQLAQHIAGEVPGIGHVVNEIDVVKASRGPIAGSGTRIPPQFSGQESCIH